MDSEDICLYFYVFVLARVWEAKTSYLYPAELAKAGM